MIWLKLLAIIFIKILNAQILSLFLEDFQYISAERKILLCVYYKCIFFYTTGAVKSVHNKRVFTISWFTISWFFTISFYGSGLGAEQAVHCKRVFTITELTINVNDCNIRYNSILYGILLLSKKRICSLFSDPILHDKTFLDPVDHSFN